MGDSSRPHRAICSGLTDAKIQLQGGTTGDRLWAEVPGHWAELNGLDGNDTLIGSQHQRDVVNGGTMADVITISHAGDANVDTADCGTYAGAPDQAADTVNFNGSDVVSNCNGRDTKNFSSK